MDAAFAAIKKTAIVLSLALLAAMPRLAKAATPAFTCPTPTTVFTLSSGGGSVTVTGSQDSASPAAPISFSGVRDIPGQRSALASGRQRQHGRPWRLLHRRKQ